MPASVVRLWCRTVALASRLRSLRRMTTAAPLTIRDLRRDEYATLARWMVDVSANLDGFPNPAEQPAYYEMLMNIGRFAEKPDTRVLVAISAQGDLVGGVVYFGDMAGYGSGGTATAVKDASGIR